MDYKSFPADKHGYDMLFVVIDRLSKQSYSIPCHKTINVRGMAELFLKYIWCREGYPDSIVSDRGPQFVSSFWAKVCRILGIKIKLSTAFHPQTDGQTEIMNQYIDQRLRPFVNHYQDNWSALIPMMDYAQLTLYHKSIRMSPFELLKGFKPRTT
jgi:transposase InsO family protein